MGREPFPIKIRRGVAVDSPHHVHKGTLTPGDADAGRGSSGIRDAGRLVYTLTPMSEDEARMFGIAAADRSGYIRLDSAKVNITAKTGKPSWFRLIGVNIGNGTPEYPTATPSRSWNHGRHPTHGETMGGSTGGQY
jgi:hypothetical protein